MLIDKRLERQLMYSMLLDFSDSSFVSDPADGKNCMTSSCANAGHTFNVVKAFCNTTDSNARGL